MIHKNTSNPQPHKKNTYYYGIVHGVIVYYPITILYNEMNNIRSTAIQNSYNTEFINKYL